MFRVRTGGPVMVTDGMHVPPIRERVLADAVTIPTVERGALWESCQLRPGARRHLAFDMNHVRRHKASRVRATKENGALLHFGVASPRLEHAIAELIAKIMAALLVIRPVDRDRHDRQR